MSKKAVVLLSGGLDSATALFIAKNRDYQCHALIFDYGQRHKKEVGFARRIARLANCKARVIKFTLPHKASSLLDKTLKLTQSRKALVINGRIPQTYVPARNTIFLSFAASFAEAIGARAIFIGVNSIDFSGYPDCRPKYIKCFNKLLIAGTKRGSQGKDIKILAPLINMTKAEIIKVGTRLKVPYELTWSCYNGRSSPCGACDSCLLRKKGFAQAGAEDPLLRQ